MKKRNYNKKDQINPGLAPAQWFLRLNHSSSTLSRVVQHLQALPSPLKKKTQTTQMEYYDLAEENKKLTSFSSLNVTKRVVGETVF